MNKLYEDANKHRSSGSALKCFVMRHNPNRHKRAFKMLMVYLLPCLYLTAVPAEIVKYGIKTNMPAFANGAPFYEVYSVFCVVWILGHLVIAGVLGLLYWGCYGGTDDRD